MNFRGNYPAIHTAACHIALDNGAINRTTSSKEVLERMYEAALKEHKELLPQTEAFLAALSEDDLEELCCGEEGVVEAPEFVSNVLLAMFNRI